MRRWPLLAVLLLTAGCFYPPAPFGQGGRGPPPSLEEVRSVSSNGEMIYFTGYNEDGIRTPSTGGPGWLYMHGGACVTCHGQDGKGGTVPHMCAEVAPDITYHALTEEEHEEADAHEEPHPPYTDETIREAITEGVEPNGEGLDPCMPRWDMSDGDLNDLIDYLKTLE